MPITTTRSLLCQGFQLSPTRLVQIGPRLNHKAMGKHLSPHTISPRFNDRIRGRAASPAIIAGCQERQLHGMKPPSPPSQLCRFARLPNLRCPRPPGTMRASSQTTLSWPPSQPWGSKPRLASIAASGPKLLQPHKSRHAPHSALGRLGGADKRAPGIGALPLPSPLRLRSAPGSPPAAASGGC